MVHFIVGRHPKDSVFRNASPLTLIDQDHPTEKTDNWIELVAVDLRFFSTFQCYQIAEPRIDFMLEFDAEHFLNVMMTVWHSLLVSLRTERFLFLFKLKKWNNDDWVFRSEWPSCSLCLQRLAQHVLEYCNAHTGAKMMHGKHWTNNVWFRNEIYSSICQMKSNHRQSRDS